MVCERPAAATVGLSQKGQSKSVKVRTSVKRMCEYCRVVRRRGVVRIICSRNPRHKQRQG